MLKLLKKYFSDLLFAAAAGADICLTLLRDYRTKVVEEYTTNNISHSEHLTYLVNLVYDYRALIILCLIILAISLKVFDSYAEKKSHKESLKTYLDKVHSRYFCQSLGVFDPDVRITFFKPKVAFPFVTFKKFKPRICKRLMMSSRSGDRYQESDVKIAMERLSFKTPKGKKTVDYWDGIVGECWVTGVKIPVEGLPDFNNSNKQQQKHYKKKTNLEHKSDKEFAKFSMRPRSIVANTLRNKSSQKVGVLVIESIHDKVFNFHASCNLSNNGRLFTEQVFDDILENIQCIYLE
ncbi:hypothetical protein ACES2I_04280 [Bdellovibrio bacteriovorus]|uniref:hypothetical protein n=1 Tax=Bdellovibrio bacteriovorus TaxID=959 RepID=UPI0035A6D68D